MQLVAEGSQAKESNLLVEHLKLSSGDTASNNESYYTLESTVSIFYDLSLPWHCWDIFLVVKSSHLIFVPLSALEQSGVWCCHARLVRKIMFSSSTTLNSDNYSGFCVDKTECIILTMSKKFSSLFFWAWKGSFSGVNLTWQTWFIVWSLRWNHFWRKECRMSENITSDYPVTHFLCLQHVIPLS